jgi:chloride channel protein, CIC family
MAMAGGKSSSGDNRLASTLDAGLDSHENKLLLAWTLVIAGIIGAVTVAFMLASEKLGHYLLPEAAAPWRRFIMPIGGAALVGFLLRRFFPGAAGSGIPQTKAALILHGGYIPFRTAAGKFICSTITLGSGISLGREGPSVQVGAGIASALGRRLGLDARRVAALVPAGAAAAVSAAFNTPIAAVLFTLEELVGNLHAPMLGSVVLSSATSWLVMRALLGNDPLFHVPPYQLVHPLELVFYVALGLLGGLVSAFFVKLLLWIRAFFARFPDSTKQYQPIAGGLTAGLIALFVPQVLGVGYGLVDDALNGKVLLSSMVLLLALKIFATAACYSSGNAGGIFGPSLFIGAMAGGIAGHAAHAALPDLTGSVGAYALAGMGAAFAGIVRAPLTSVIMIFEITRDYSIIVPLMISNLISYFVSQRLQAAPVYEALLSQDNIHLPPPRTEFRATLVRDAMRQTEGSPEPAGSIHEDEPLESALRLLAAKAAGAELAVIARGHAGGIQGRLALADVLSHYAKAPADQVPPRRAGKPLLFAVALALGGILMGATVYNYTSRRQKLEAAAARYRAAEELSRDGRHNEAIELYRDSLASLRGEEQRLGLARALVQAGRLNEARVYLQDLLSRHPASGPANFWMGRVEMILKAYDPARLHLNRAIYGDWPAFASKSKRDARWELAGLFAAQGDMESAANQCDELLREYPADTALAIEAGRRHFEWNLPDRAVRIFAKLYQTDKENPAITSGYARSLFAAGDYARAARLLRIAAIQAPGREDIARELLMAQEIVERSPFSVGLRASERLERTRRLVADLRAALDACGVRVPSDGMPPAARLRDLAVLWNHRGAECNAANGVPGYLAPLMASKDVQRLTAGDGDASSARGAASPGTP